MLRDAAVYRDERRLPVWNLADALTDCTENGGFLWVGLVEPDVVEMETVAEQLDLHPLAVEDAARGHQRPKLEQYRGSTFLVLRTVKYIDSSSDIETGEVMIFVGEHFIVTVRKGTFPVLGDVRKRVEETPEELRFGPTGVLYALMDSIVDHYLEVENELEIDLQEIEAAVFQGGGDDLSTTIYQLKREVLEFRRSVVPLVEPCRKLAAGTVRYVRREGREFFGDVYDHLMRVTDQVDSNERLLSDVLNANLSQISLRQNNDMRKISAWAAIAVFPTLVAGVYGMNFQHMPELGWRYGYAYALFLMAAIMGGLYWWFRRSGWL